MPGIRQISGILTGFSFQSFVLANYEFNASICLPYTTQNEMSIHVYIKKYIEGLFKDQHPYFGKEVFFF